MSSALVAPAAAAVAVLLLLRPPPGTGAARDDPPGRGLMVLAGGAVGLALALGSAALAGAVSVAAVAGLAARALVRVRRRRLAAAQVSARVLETCELLAAELTAGQSPVVALRRAAGEWPALGPVAETAELGGDPAGVLADLAATRGAEDLRLVAAAWAVAHRTGAGLAAALDRVAEAIRARRATRRVVESELASARATARLVAALPVVMLVLGSGEGLGPWRVLLGHPAGIGCLVLGLALGFLGLWWIERIADGVRA
jgi:tight adherence protein B